MVQNYFYRRGLLACLAITSMIASSVSWSAEPLRVAFIAYQNPGRLAEDVKPVVSYLEKTLERPVKQFVSTNYAGIVEALRNESADIGFMGPLQYIIAKQRAGAELLLGEVYGESSTYTSKIFVRKDSGIDSLEELQFRSIAFVDPISSSGYLYPLTIFRDKGVLTGKPEAFFKKTYFAGGDEQAIRAVFNNFVDAAGVGEFAYSLLRPEERDAVVAIGESRPIPSHCIVARAGLSEALKTAIREAFLALNEGTNKHLLKNLYGVDGYVAVNEETYAPVEKVAEEHGLVKP
jgi:phosphonate transport system substrate-binding protein